MGTTESHYRADLKRMELSETGIYVRATLDGKWGSHDIAHLERDSLRWWLDSKPNLARNTVLALLGHSIPPKTDPCTPP